MTDELIHYKLKDNADNVAIADDTDNGYNGICSVNTNVLSEAGKLGNAINFGLGNRNIIAPVLSELSIYSNQTFSISFWIKAVFTTSQVLCGTWNGSVGWFFGLSKSKLEFYIERATTPTYYTVDDSLTFGSWVHITLIVTDGLPQIFLDNLEVTYDSTDAGTGAIEDDSALAMYIGSRNGGGYANAVMDDFRVYDEAIPPAVRGYIYNNGTGTEDGYEETTSESETTSPTTSNRMQRGLNRLMDRFKSVNAVTITYSRGTTIEIEGIIASVGRTPYDVIDGDVLLSVETRDYFIEKTDLVNGSTQLYPASGDRVTDEDGRVYEVSCPRGDNVYENLGPDKTVFKVHTVGQRP